MNWNKSKNILILAFLGLNIFLALNLIGLKKDLDPSLTNEFISRSVKLLEEKDISLKIDIPKTRGQLKSLIVEYESLDPGKVNEDFFAGQGEIEILDTGDRMIKFQDQELKIADRKALSYRVDREMKLLEDYDPDQLEKEARDFIKDRNLAEDGLKLLYKGELDGIYILRFIKTSPGGVDIENSYIDIWIDEKGILALEKLWLISLKEEDKLIRIANAPQALLGLINMKEHYGKEIVRIDLVHYFDPDIDYLDGPSQARKGRTSPAWRVVFSNGDKEILGGI